MENQHWTKPYHENHAIQTEDKERQWFLYFCNLTVSFAIGSIFASFTPMEDYSRLIFFANLPVILFCLILANFNAFSEPNDFLKKSTIQDVTELHPYKYAYKKVLRTLDGLILYNMMMGLLLLGTNNSNWVLVFGFLAYFIFYILIITHAVVYQVNNKKKK